MAGWVLLAIYIQRFGGHCTDFAVLRSLRLDLDLDFAIVFVFGVVNSEVGRA